MAETLLQLPDLPRAQDARKGRILAEAARILTRGTQELANLLQRVIQNLTPFGIATEQGGSVGVQAGPAGQILLGDPKQGRLLTQARGGAAPQFKTDFVYQLVTHDVNLAGRFAEVNAAATNLLIGTSNARIIPAKASQSGSSAVRGKGLLCAVNGTEFFSH
jgi:hypothetical protein